MSVHTVAAWLAALFLASSVFAHTVALRLLLLAAGIVLASIVVAKNWKDIRPLPPIWLPFLLWGGWTALSLAWSLEPERTLKEWRNEVFYTGAALWVCYIGAQARHAARIFLPVLGSAGAVACLLALRDFARDWKQYLVGWHGGPGNHSSALLVLMPCAVMAGWYLHRTGAGRWQRVWPWVLALLFLISSYYTLNRTVWLGLMVEALLVGALVLRRRRLVDESPLGTTMKLAAAAGAALIVGVGAALMLNVHAERESAVDPAAGTKDSRVELWRESMAWIAERPLTGHGFGRGLLRDELRAKLHGINLWHAHNYFLDTVVQTGVPGLLLFVLLLAAMVRAGWRMSRDADLGIAACGIALLCIVAGMAVRNMTDTLLVRQNALLFWGLAGVLLAWGSKAPRA